MELPFFILFALGTVLSALMVVTRRNVVHAVLFLILTFFFVAGLFVMLNAEFLAAVQVLIYAGGIMVLYLFAVLLMRIVEAARMRQWQRQGPVALVFGVLLAVEIFLVATKSYYPQANPAPTPPVEGNTEAFGSVLFTKFLFPFEVASLLLLAAIIGALVLAKREIER
ncbi:MAG: NADH-quinone oxidoreductase subunit J [Nitrospinota bacterium]